MVLQILPEHGKFEISQVPDRPSLQLPFTMAQLKVLIVGGGITGPALAHWLSKLDCDITIVERAPDLRASGQQIDLRGEGVTVMRKSKHFCSPSRTLFIKHYVLRE